ncbi:hypothetical protein VNO77_18283 [Canavalia gladiata]|uniref:Uncharacterized protein n=1 Tax=Canavalia gladiata TaxID=3824 RepID=A0AAN9QNJ3_CANGL
MIHTIKILKKNAEASVEYNSIKSTSFIALENLMIPVQLLLSLYQLSILSATEDVLLSMKMASIENLGQLK